MNKRLSASPHTSNMTVDGTLEGGTSVADTVTSPASQPNRKSPVSQPGRPLISISAGIIFAAIVLGVVAGTIWGVIRPGQNVQFIAPDQFGVVAESLNAPFMALVWFSGLTLVLGVLVAIIAFVRARKYRSVAMQLWVGLAALIGAVVAFMVGQVVAGFRQPDLTNLENGATLTVIPAFESYASLLVAPLGAMIAYWIGLLFTEEDMPVTEEPGLSLGEPEES